MKWKKMFLRHTSMSLWALFTSPYIAQCIHSAMVIKITTVLHTDALCSMHIYHVAWCDEAAQGPRSRFSFSSFCKPLFFLLFVLPLFFVCLFTILSFSLFLPFRLSFFLLFLFLRLFYLFLSFFSSSFFSFLYFSLSAYLSSFSLHFFVFSVCFFLPFHLPSFIFLYLYTFFYLFLTGSLLSLIPATSNYLHSRYPSIIYIFFHPNFLLSFSLQTFLSHFLPYRFPFFLSLVPRFGLRMPKLWQLLI